MDKEDKIINSKEGDNNSQTKTAVNRDNKDSSNREQRYETRA